MTKTDICEEIQQIIKSFDSKQFAKILRLFELVAEYNEITKS